MADAKEIGELLESFAKKEKSEREEIKKEIGELRNQILEGKKEVINKDQAFDDGFIIEVKFKHIKITKEQQDLFVRELKELMKQHKVYGVEAVLVHKF